MNIINVASSTLIVLIPVTIIMLIGYISKKRGWLTEKGAVSISKFVFYISLPSLIIDEVSKTGLSTVLELKGPFVLIIVSTIVASLGYISAYIKNLPPSNKGVWAQSAFRGNISFIGIAITLNAIGEQGFYYCSINIAIAIPTFNILSIIFLSLAQKNKSIEKKHELYIYIIKNIFKNPLSIGILIGVLLSFIRPESFPILDVSLAAIKKTTLPLALISMGGQINFKESLNIIPKAMLPILYKLIVAPVIGGILLFMLGAKNEDIITTVVFLGAPTAILSYIMAAEMDGDHILALNIIFASTLLCFITYCIMLFTLGLLGVWEYKNPI